MYRSPVVGAVLVVLAGACAAGGPGDSTTSLAPTNAPAVASSTATTRPLPTTTISATSTSTTTAAPVEFAYLSAPADGQWFHQRPIPWVFPMSQNGPMADSVPGALGSFWNPAVVAINGLLPTRAEPLSHGPYQGEPGFRWLAPEVDHEPIDWEVGENTVVFTATFNDGTVVEESRRFHYDPTLNESTGWLVEIDHDAMTMTIAFAPYGVEDPQIGPWAGFLSEATSVSTLPLADDAAFVLLEPHSGGQPPPSVLDYEEFVAMIDKAEAGDCDYCQTSQCQNPCYFTASPHGHSFFSPPDEVGDGFILLIGPDNHIQQIEQIWRE